MMYDGLHSSHGAWFRDAYTRAYPTHRWFILEVFVLFEACLFWEDVFILRHSYLTKFLHWDSTFCLLLPFPMGYKVINTSSSVFSEYLVQLWYPFSFVGHPDILLLSPLYLHPSCQSLIDIKPTYFVILHDIIPFSWLGEDINQSWAFWLSFHMPLYIRFNIFHDSSAY